MSERDDREGLGLSGEIDVANARRVRTRLDQAVWTRRSSAGSRPTPVAQTAHAPGIEFCCIGWECSSGSTAMTAAKNSNKLENRRSMASIGSYNVSGLCHLLFRLE